MISVGSRRKSVSRRCQRPARENSSYDDEGFGDEQGLSTNATCAVAAATATAPTTLLGASPRRQFSAANPFVEMAPADSVRSFVSFPVSLFPRARPSESRRGCEEGLVSVARVFGPTGDGVTDGGVIN